MKYIFILFFFISASISAQHFCDYPIYGGSTFSSTVTRIDGSFGSAYTSTEIGFSLSYIFPRKEIKQNMRTTYEILTGMQMVNRMGISYNGTPTRIFNYRIPLIINNYLPCLYNEKGNPVLEGFMGIGYHITLPMEVLYINTPGSTKYFNHGLLTSGGISVRITNGARVQLSKVLNLDLFTHKTKNYPINETPLRFIAQGIQFNLLVPITCRKPLKKAELEEKIKLEKKVKKK